MARLDEIEAKVREVAETGNLDGLQALLQNDLPWLFRVVRNNPGYFGAAPAAADESVADELRAEIDRLTSEFEDREAALQAEINDYAEQVVRLQSVEVTNDDAEPVVEEKPKRGKKS